MWRRTDQRRFGSQAPKIHDLIDIGVRDAKEACLFGSAIHHLNDDLSCCATIWLWPAFDNRIGTFTVAETLRLLAGSRGKMKAEIAAVSNIMEEVGLLEPGSAYSLKPDVALVVTSRMRPTIRP